MRLKTVSRILSFTGFLWIFTTINPFYVWSSYGNFLKVFVGILVIVSTFLLYHSSLFVLTKTRLFLAFSILIFFIYLTLMGDSGGLATFTRFFVFSPFVLLSFWSNQVLYEVYVIFRRVIVFFAIGAIVITILLVTGFISYFPYYEVEAQSNVHEMHDISYRIYGCIVTINSFVSSILPRACGPLQEPGHFAIILGFVFLIDRFIKAKINKWIVICGFLTFSMNFFIFAFLGELYDIFFNKVGVKKLWLYLSIPVVGMLVFFILNEELQEQITYLIYDRNLKSVMESYASTNSLSGALDERVNQTGIFYYEQFIRSSDVMYGLGTVDEKVVLSDYRGLILRLGIIGFVVSVVLAYTSLLGVRYQQAIFLIGGMGLIYLHRAWMMQQPYIYFLVFLAVCAYNYRVKQNQICDLR